MKHLKLLSILLLFAQCPYAQTAVPIPQGADLNAYTTIGTFIQQFYYYSQPSSGALNYPENQMGVLTVIGTNDNTTWITGTKYQMYQTVTNHMFVRSEVYGSWNAWTLVTPVNTTAYIPTGTSLDTYTTAGKFMPADANVTIWANGYPETGNGILTVSGTDYPLNTAGGLGTRFQTYQTASNHIYARSAYLGNWGPWLLQTTNNTATGLSGDLNIVYAPGKYIQWARTQIADGTHYPEPKEGLLTVDGMGDPLTTQGKRFQSYQTFETNHLYIRFEEYGNWSGWTQVGGGVTSQWATTGNNISYGTGNVGIGTTSAPRSKLDIWGGQLNVTGPDINGTAIITASGGTAYFSNNSVGNGLSILPSGNVLIGNVSGTGANSYLLNVAGPIRANKLTVNTNGADFVFGPSYRPMPLADLESFVKHNHHLPGIAPAMKMQKEGVELGESQTKLLEKVEEISLYLIQQNKTIEMLKKKIAVLEAQK